MSLHGCDALVSVIIPTYNYANFLQRAIDSVVNQTYKNFEIIVIDDGSTDLTSSIVQQNRCVKYYYQQNKGLAAARNAGIQKSNGNYLVFLDADDWLEKDALEQNLSVIHDKPEVAFVSGNHYFFRVATNAVHGISVSVQDNYYVRLLESNYIGMHAAVMFQRWVFTEYCYDENLKACEDYDLYLNIARKHPVIHHDKFIATYYFHNSGLSHNYKIMMDAVKAVIKKQAPFIQSPDEKRAYNKGMQQWKDYYTLMEEPAIEMSGQHNLLPQVIVLMYHRINNVDTDPWGICVSPYHFEEQVKFLKKNFNIISSAELIQQLTSNSILQNSICITFDDGHTDNYINAKPILEKYNCPATFFIATAFINQTNNFWWDMLEVILLHAKNLPAYLCLIIAENKYEYVINETELSDVQYHQHKNWKWYEEPPTTRCKVFIDIWQKLRALSYHEIEIKIKELKEWASINEAVCNRHPMNENQLRELSNNNLFTIGLHTHTHADLKGIEKNFQIEEILISKKNLNNKFGIESNCLAYPYGSYDEETINVVKQLKLAGCFTTDAVAINSNTNILRLGRYQVCNWNIEEFKNYLKGWSNKWDSI